ncbi:MAG: iron-sulfur protein [Acidimicrobiaceae bacterium]|jgi:phenylpropionate dioxygenase-like ring-hydroxylating dioxygenase large terminal subunit|nr:iron-sulfur protein [Acidimicrobiaceae bacterium]|tara:strand:- start:1509 stop:2885 length:1377 start_codon:yes stop_codon:yes gene_type:complete
MSKDVDDQIPLERSPGPSWQDVLDQDSRPVPDFLRAESPYLNGFGDIPKDRYLSREWHEKEKDCLWSRVWQFACREEQIPEVGSYIVYEIADQSYLVTRVSEDEIKAYPNVCLHRGRLLKTYDGRCSEFRCPYHGFAWHLDGELKHIPAEWDFPHLEARSEDMALPEVKVGTWAGFVFINPDPEAESLQDFLGEEILRHFERWDLENRYIQAHVSKIVNCNWKIANEAFSEGFHVNATHPQGMTYTGDPQSQVDIWGNTARNISPKGIPCPLLSFVPTEEQMLRDALDVREGEPLPIPFEDGETMRTALSRAGRERFRDSFGDRVDDLTDAEFLDAWVYTVFPNFMPWGAFNRIFYRFRPNGDEHESCIFEIFYLAPFSGDRPPPATETKLGPSDPWTDAQELEKLAMVAEQDTFNMQRVHQGLKVLRREGVLLSRYQESIVRWRQDLIQEYVELGPR